ncbi:MAG: stage III sporulation protein AC [Clostridiales bacterium]|nr:stage III sporulation protein AC [Clostridiales bacterium]
MEVDLIFQIAGIGIVVAVINQLLSRAGRDEQALLVTIAGLVVVLFILTERIGQLFIQIKQIFNL